MLVIAGLGNPGRQYAGNRHNIGFMAADAIHRRHGFSPWTRKSGAEIAEGRLGGEKTILIKPQTFMNLSGQAIGEIARYYKVPPEHIIVIHDELDLAPGKIKTKIGGGHGGHNGLKSTDAHIGNDYRRVRIGIGHPGSRERVNGHVLGDFAKADQEWLEPTLDALAKNIVLLAEGEEDRFKSTIGSQTAPPDESTLGSKKPKADRASVEEAPGEPLNTAPKRGPMAEMLAKFFKTTE